MCLFLWKQWWFISCYINNSKKLHSLAGKFLFNNVGWFWYSVYAYEWCHLHGWLKYYDQYGNGCSRLLL